MRSLFALFGEGGTFYGKREFDSLRHLSIRVNVAGNPLSKLNFSNDGFSIWMILTSAVGYRLSGRASRSSFV